MQATDSQCEVCSAAEVGDWLRLVYAPGIGLSTARQLLRVFGLPSALFAQTPEALAAGIGRPAALERMRRLLSPPSAALLALQAATRAWIEQPNHAVLTLADAAYPASLLHIPDPPLMLYAKGQRALLHGPCMAVVGSRNASAQGLLNAQLLSRAMSEAGITIVSGLAQGIDAAAHRGGLSGPGATVAVLGTGVDLFYPACNRKLAERIAQEGCLLSEYSLGEPARSENFPRRNRLISGLARGVLVVEAAARSGSLITARMALEQGREVLAVPGSIHSPLAKGCHALLKNGAKLVETAKDILDEIGQLPALALPPAADSLAQRIDALPKPFKVALAPTQAAPAAPPLEALAPEERTLLGALGFDPATADALAERTNFNIATTLNTLLNLELKGQVARQPGGLFQRTQESKALVPGQA